MTVSGCGSAGKESTCNAGDLGLTPGLGRSPGEGKGNPLQYAGLENSEDCIVHSVAKSRPQLSDSHTHLGEVSRFCPEAQQGAAAVLQFLLVCPAAENPPGLCAEGLRPRPRFQVSCAWTLRRISSEIAAPLLASFLLSDFLTLFPLLGYPLPPLSRISNLSLHIYLFQGLPWRSAGSDFAFSCSRCGSDPWLGS